MDALPTAFESLAGIAKVIAVPKLSPDFYVKHCHPVDFAISFLRVLAGNYPALEQAFRLALPVAISEGAIPIQEALTTLDLTDDKVRWFDAQMTAVLRALLPVVRDPGLPPWLAECKWAVEGAFEP
jgi:hypothetical protein